jgi:hypothetical protein
VVDILAIVAAPRRKGLVSTMAQRVLAAPVYWSNVPGIMKTFFDRHCGSRRDWSRAKPIPFFGIDLPPVREEARGKRAVLLLVTQNRMDRLHFGGRHRLLLAGSLPADLQARPPWTLSLRSGLDGGQPVTTPVHGRCAGPNRHPGWRAGAGTCRGPETSPSRQRGGRNRVAPW